MLTYFIPDNKQIYSLQWVLEGLCACDIMIWGLEAEEDLV